LAADEWAVGPTGLGVMQAMAGVGGLVGIEVGVFAPEIDVVTQLVGEFVTQLDVVEIVAHVALNTLTNYVNEVAETTIDFPAVKARDAA